MAEEDIWNHPDTVEWMEHVKETMVPKMDQSAASVTLWNGGVDVKIAVETGFGILMDKPIIVAVMPGVKVPNKLVKVADGIVEFDPENPGKLIEAINGVLERLGVDDGD